MDLLLVDIPRSIRRRRLVYKSGLTAVVEFFGDYFIYTALMILYLVLFFLHLSDKPPHPILLGLCGLSAAYLLLCHYLSGKLIRIEGREEAPNHDLILSVMQSRYPRYVLDEGRYLTTFKQPARRIILHDRIFIFLQDDEDIYVTSAILSRYGRGTTIIWAVYDFILCLRIRALFRQSATLQ